MPAADEKPRLEARLLLISNRLPITIKRSADGKYDFSMSSGGLVTGLSGLSKTTTFQWYGWPGLEVPEEEAKDLTTRLKDEYGAIPVFVDDELADKHYNGFSSMFCFDSHRPMRLTISQTRSCGHCFIIIQARSLSTKQHGKPTPK